MLARAAVGGPYDFADALHRVDQDHCFRPQVPRRGGPARGQVIVDGMGRVSAGRDRKRAPEKVDAPTGVSEGITRVSAELRGAEVPRSAPPCRERPIVMLGIEGPDVEVLDAVASVHVVQGSALAQSSAKQAASIAAGTARITLEELDLGIVSQRGEMQKVSYLDMGQRPIHVLGHSAILPPKRRPMRCRDERHAAEADIANRPRRRVPMSLGVWFSDNLRLQGGRPKAASITAIDHELGVPIA